MWTSSLLPSGSSRQPSVTTAKVCGPTGLSVIDLFYTENLDHSQSWDNLGHVENQLGERKYISFIFVLCIQITEFKKTWLVTITRSYSKHFNSIALFSLPSYLILFLLFLIVLLLLSFLQEDGLISWPGVFLKENRSEKELGSGHSIWLSCGHLCVCHMYIPG